MAQPWGYGMTRNLAPYGATTRYRLHWREKLINGTTGYTAGERPPLRGSVMQRNSNPGRCPGLRAVATPWLAIQMLAVNLQLVRCHWL
ncbi:hypothetical protein [Persicirhabdus sediminis]|uniref:Uncharacterized protein n=1 Tax=Persicirhabdus sediminis TaxID=454144 RepID=A0A8J7MF13_9BACT|nr:hypothetical protein [Persicirhabdus sediminis]MBK1791483.1 hypothetical protein [Persicirhabdus sediminis]